MYSILNNLSNQTKNIVYTFLLILLVFVFWKYRQSVGIETNRSKTTDKVTIYGETMGTTYSIISFGSEKVSLQFSIDSLLETFNKSLNTYLVDSEISTFNRDTSFTFISPYFYPVLEKSREVYTWTEGRFDPTVMPLVNAWGFGPENIKLPDSLTVKEILQTVGFSKIDFNAKEVWKLDTKTTLDFSAIAKGYGVDVVSGFLSAKGFGNHFVEIGGEVRCEGINLDTGKAWKVGITDPSSSLGETKLYAAITLQDAAIATSGNYYNFREIEGVKYAHTIDPVTGYPVQHEMLSASVIARDCMTADALATAFMVAGIKKSIELIEKIPETEAVFIYLNASGEVEYYMTENIKKAVQLTPKQE